MRYYISSKSARDARNALIEERVEGSRAIEYKHKIIIKNKKEKSAVKPYKIFPGPNNLKSVIILKSGKKLVIDKNDNLYYLKEAKNKPNIYIKIKSKVKKVYTDEDKIYIIGNNQQLYMADQDSLEINYKNKKDYQSYWSKYFKADASRKIFKHVINPEFSNSNVEKIAKDGSTLYIVYEDKGVLYCKAIQNRSDFKKLFKRKNHNWDYKICSDAVINNLIKKKDCISKCGNYVPHTSRNRRKALEKGRSKSLPFFDELMN